MSVDIESDDVYGLQYTSVDILCKIKSSIDYCWFRDPSGNKIFLSDRAKSTDTDTYRWVNRYKTHFFGPFLSRMN